MKFPSLGDVFNLPRKSWEGISDWWQTTKHEPLKGLGEAVLWHPKMYSDVFGSITGIKEPSSIVRDPTTERAAGLAAAIAAAIYGGGALYGAYGAGSAAGGAGGASTGAGSAGTGWMNYLSKAKDLYDLYNTVNSMGSSFQSPPTQTNWSNEYYYPRRQALRTNLGGYYGY